MNFTASARWPSRKPLKAFGQPAFSFSKQVPAYLPGAMSEARRLALARSQKRLPKPPATDGGTALPPAAGARCCGPAAQ
jgi:hypothetical protein